MPHDPLLEVAERYGTPCHVFDLDALDKRMTAIRRAVPDAIELCYSIKANPFLTPFMADRVDRLEVCSPGELTICERCGVPPGRILFSGVHKTRADVERALEYGVTLYTAESLGQAELVNACAVERRRKVSLIPRLTGGSQFGMSRDDLFLLLGERRKRYGGADIVGLHFFSGTQKKNPEAVISELRMIRELCAAIRERFELCLPLIEYGPGLGVPYFISDADETGLSLLEAIVPDLAETAAGHTLTIEMGRYFAAFCGCYLTRIVDAKRHDETRYAVADGGIHHVVYTGQNMGLRIPFIRNLSQNPVGDSGLWTLCGSLCTTGDILVRKAELSLAPGDILCFERTGAYSATEGMSLFLSRDLPKIVLIRNGTPALVRDALPTSRLNCPC